MNHRKLFDRVVWAVFILVAALQMARIRVPVFTDYGADVACPLALYVLARRRVMLPFNILKLRPSPVLAALSVLIPCYIWEFCQRYDLSGTPLFFTKGHFDPLDLVAYTLAVGIPFLLDQRRTPWFAAVTDFDAPAGTSAEHAV